MQGAEFKRDADGAYRVAGDLSFATVRDVLRASTQAFAASGELAIDLSQVTNADSAGLALLIEWYRWAVQRNQSMRFIDTPQQLRALAKISDLESVLPFA